MEKISKRIYEELKSRNPKSVRKSKRTFWRIEQSTYNPRARLNQIFTYPNYRAAK